MTTTPPVLDDLQLLALLDRADSASLPNNQLRMLLLIKSSTPENPTENPTTIANRMKISSAAITNLATELLKRHLITRERSPDDDRKVLFAITPKGTAYLDTIRTGENLDAIV